MPAHAARSHRHLKRRHQRCAFLCALGHIHAPMRAGLVKRVVGPGLGFFSVGVRGSWLFLE